VNHPPSAAAPTAAPADVRRPVLLFDGECGLCHAIVRFLLRADRTGRLHFAPLQSAPAQAYLRTRGLPTADFDSLVFVSDWSRPELAPLLRTDGALAALGELGGRWTVFARLRTLPRRLRDPCYALVARTRYALFGRYRPRPLADPSWSARFLG
jgi:predicted DCC family thiol-disulfide oxidoreductase YuxK